MRLYLDDDEPYQYLYDKDTRGPFPQPWRLNWQTLGRAILTFACNNKPIVHLCMVGDVAFANGGN